MQKLIHLNKKVHKHVNLRIKKKKKKIELKTDDG